MKGMPTKYISPTEERVIRRQQEFDLAHTAVMHQASQLKKEVDDCLSRIDILLRQYNSL